MAASSRLIIRITGESSDLDRTIARTQRNLIGLSEKFSAFAAPALIPLTVGIGGLGAASLKSAADLDSLTRGLSAVTKESGPLENQLARLRDVAKLPGLGFQEAVKGSVNLQAAGFSASLAERALRSFGNALATVGKGRAELDGVILALTQIQGKGRFAAQEFNQLAERLPQIRIAVREAFGTTDTEAIGRLGISSEEAITRIIEQFEKLPPVTGGIANDFENLRDRASQSLAEIGKVIVPFASAALNALDPLIAGVGVLAQGFQKLPEPIKATAVALGALTIAVAPIAKLVSIILDLRVAIIGFGAAAATVITGPAALLVAGAAAIATGLGVAISKIDDFVKRSNAAASGLPDIARQFQAKAFAVARVDLGVDVSRPLELANRQAKEAQEAASRVSQAFADLGNLKPFSDIQAEARKAREALAVVRAEVSAGRRPIQDLQNATAGYHDIMRKLGLETAPAASQKLREHRGEVDNVVKAWSDLDRSAVNLAKISSVFDQIKAALAIVGDSFDKAFAGSAIDKAGGDLLTVGQSAQLVAGNFRTLDEIFQRTETSGVDLGKALESNTAFLEKQSTAAVTAANSLAGFTQAQLNAATSQAFAQFGEQTFAPVITPRPITLAPTIDFKDSDEVVQNFLKLQNQAVEGAAQIAGRVQFPTKKVSEFGRQVSTVITDLSRGIADVIINGKSLGEVFRAVFIDINKAILRYGIEQAIKPLLGALDSLIGKIGGLKNLFTEAFGGGFSGAGRAVSSAAGSAGQAAAGGVQSAGSAASSAALSGTLGFVSVGLQAASAVFEGLQYFQQRRMEQDIGRLEVTSRGQLNQLISIQNTLNQWLPSLENLAVILERITLLTGVGGAAQSTVNNTTNSISITIQGAAQSGEDIARAIVQHIRRLDPRFGVV